MLIVADPRCGTRRGIIHLVSFAEEQQHAPTDIRGTFGRVYRLEFLRDPYAAPRSGRRPRTRDPDQDEEDDQEDENDSADEPPVVREPDED
jgi:hypothetical protein